MPNNRNLSPEIKKLIEFVAKKIAARLHFDAQGSAHPGNAVSAGTDQTRVKMKPKKR